MLFVSKEHSLSSLMSKIHSSSAFIFLDANYYFLGSSNDEIYICWSLGQTLLVQEFVKKWNSIGNLNPDNISISCLLSSFHGKIVFFFIIAYLGTASKKKYQWKCLNIWIWIQREREKEFIRLVVIDSLAVVSKGTAMLCVEVAVTSEFSSITFGYGLKLAGI